MVGSFANCCAPATIGHATAAPPRTPRTSRRLMPLMRFLIGMGRLRSKKIVYRPEARCTVNLEIIIAVAAVPARVPNGDNTTIAPRSVVNSGSCRGCCGAEDALTRCNEVPTAAHLLIRSPHQLAADCGMVSPSALVVLTLITNSNF